MVKRQPVHALYSSSHGRGQVIGWNLGIKESVAGVVVIGFSVDYTIHLGHMFDVARSQGLTTRREKFDYSIRKMGETVLAGAITTAGSTVFLLACQLTFFTAMGTLIILTVAYSPVWKSTSVSGARQFFTKSFLGDDMADLARSSGEEPASPRHRAGVASMAWRSTRERAVQF